MTAANPHTGFGDCGCADCWPADPIGCSDAAKPQEKRVYVVTWREERKIVEALSPRQAIGMAIPEWDILPIPTLTVTELVPSRAATSASRIDRDVAANPQDNDIVRPVALAKRYRDALERVLPLVVDLSERGWIKGAEATAIIREALNG